MATYEPKKVNTRVVIENLPSGYKVDTPKNGPFVGKLETISKYDANLGTGFEIQVYPDKVVLKVHRSGRVTFNNTIQVEKIVFPIV